MTDDRISTAPLDEGDPIGMLVATNVEHAYEDGREGDVLLVAVPPGKGLLLEAWLKRQMFGSPAEDQERREQDSLAEVTA